MLQIINTDSPANKNILIGELLSEQSSTLIVSDLQSKLYWQSQVKARVLRASEFWQFLLKKIEPSLHILDEHTTLVRLKKAIDQIPESVYSDLKINKVKPQTFLRYFYELFPLFSHPHTAEIMQYWFEEQKQTEACSWEPVFYLCKSIWCDLKRENILPEKVISSYLLHSLNYEFQWQTPLIFDLGGNLQTTESELILTLSQQIKVTLIEPKTDWIGSYHWVIWPYQQLRTRSFQELPFKNSIGTPKTTLNKYYRFTNPLSEVKMAIAQIKIWLKEGVLPNQIYITAPNIEDYWPALKWHLDLENLVYNKSSRTKLIEILSLKKIVSQLKCAILRSTHKSDLEAALFIQEETPPLKYTDFSNLYSELYSAKDYFRNHKVSEKLEFKAVKSEITAEDFLQIVIDLYPKSEVEIPLIKEIKAEFATAIPLQFKMEAHYWIYYFEQLLEKKELLGGNKDEKTEFSRAAINIIPLASLYALAECKTIFLGLSESSLKSQGNVINGSDVLSLLNKTGHLLNHPDRNYFEFILQWSQVDKNGHIYSFSETNWQTEELTPSVFWLLGFTQMQAEIFSLNFPKTIETTILKPPPKDLNTSEIFKTLSPSGLEKLNDCAFKYYVERLLNLNEEKILDLDPSPLTLGSLYHKLCELLTAEPIRFSLTDLEWDTVVGSALNTIKTNDLMAFQKIEVKNKLITWGKAFLIYEQEWRQTHPESRVFDRELKFSGIVNDIRFNGKIDRMDWDQHNQFSIVDYKSSVTQLSGPLSWIKTNQLQLLAYVYAAEKGWIDKISNDSKINGAYYLSLKTFDKKGFTSTECKNAFLTPLSSKSQLPNETITELLVEFEEILIRSIDKLKSGNIEPIPRDENICHECSWRHLCRAPHLNM